MILQKTRKMECDWSSGAQVTAAVASSQETYVLEISTVDEILAGAQSGGGSNTVPAVPQDTATTVPGSFPPLFQPCHMCAIPIFKPC